MMYIETMSHITKVQCSDHIVSGFLISAFVLYRYIYLTMKGDRKRRRNKSSAGQFKPGHEKPGPGRPGTLSDNSEYVRPNAEEAALLNVDPLIHCAMELKHPKQHTMLLRSRLKPSKLEPSRSTKSNKSRSEHDCYRVFHVEKLLQMINEVNAEHRHMFPKCQSHLTFDKTTEQQRGLVWRKRMICLRPKCSYKSKMHNLYTEVETAEKRRGPKTATVNMGLNIAMTQTSIGASSLVRILAGGNIEGPSVRGLNKKSREASKVIVSENKADMSNRLKQLRKVNRWQGRPENQIAVQIDGVYNNNLYSGVGRTPFQPATQCTVTVAENITRKRQIVAAETVNKLCPKYGFHTQGDEPCDMKAGPCSATCSMETNIGDEERWAKSCLEQLSKDGIEVKYVTTDGDGKSYEAARQLHEDGLTTTYPIHQLDTRHLSANHRKFLKSSSKVTTIMPGKTKAYRLYLQNRFALDLSQRCQAELQNLLQITDRQFHILQYTRDLISVIKHCYSGNHSLCTEKSFVCKGKFDENWIKSSIFLPSTFRINLSKAENVETLMDCIQYRLGDDTVLQTKLNTNTQKVEATNRAIKNSLPKDRTFPSAFEARAHSAIHRVNNGPGDSLSKLCSAAGCPIPIGGRVDKRLRSMQSQTEKMKIRAKSVAHRIARKIRKQRLFRLYEQHREEKKYIKNQLTRRLRRTKTSTGDRGKTPLYPSTIDHDAYARKPNISRKRIQKKPTSSADASGLMPQAGCSSDTLTTTKVIRVILKNQVGIIYTLSIMA